MPTESDEKKLARSEARERTTRMGEMTHLSGASRAKSPHMERSATRDKKGPAPAMPELNCTLAPMQTDSLLLPTNVIAEVVDYIRPAPVSGAPEWFLGQIEWGNRQVPVFSFAALINGSSPAEVNGKTRIMIVKSLSDSARMPYLGIVINDIPRLATVQMDQLVHTSDERKSLGVFCHVTVQDQPAVIPDLDRLGHLVTHAAFGILPITRTQ
jgi:chemosensory pili system protein ChpC